MESKHGGEPRRKKLQKVTFRIAVKIDILLNVMKIESMQCHTNTVYDVKSLLKLNFDAYDTWMRCHLNYLYYCELATKTEARALVFKKDNVNAWELYISIVIVNSHAMKNENNKPSTTSKIYKAKYKFKANQHGP